MSLRSKEIGGMGVDRVEGELSAPEAVEFDTWSLSLLVETSICDV
jgi:hypothetical protein